MKAHSELVGLQLAEVAAVADELQERAEAAEAQLHKEVTSRIAVEVRAVRAESLATHRGELASRQGVVGDFEAYPELRPVPTRPAGYTGDGSRADSGTPAAASR
jgi:hypothetical protein